MQMWGSVGAGAEEVAEMPVLKGGESGMPAGTITKLGLSATDDNAKAMMK